MQFFKNLFLFFFYKNNIYNKWLSSFCGRKQNNSLYLVKLLSCSTHKHLQNELLNKPFGLNFIFHYVTKKREFYYPQFSYGHWIIQKNYTEKFFGWIILFSDLQTISILYRIVCFVLSAFSRIFKYHNIIFR